MINRSVIGCQIELKTAERGQGAADKLKKRRAVPHGHGNADHLLVMTGTIGNCGSPAILDIFSSFGLAFPSMIEGNV